MNNFATTRGELYSEHPTRRRHIDHRAACASVPARIPRQSRLNHITDEIPAADYPRANRCWHPHRRVDREGHGWCVTDRRRVSHGHRRFARICRHTSCDLDALKICVHIIAFSGAGQDGTIHPWEFLIEWAALANGWPAAPFVVNDRIHTSGCDRRRRHRHLAEMIRAAISELSSSTAENWEPRISGLFLY